MDNLEIAENGKGEEASPYMYDSAEEKDEKGMQYSLALFKLNVYKLCTNMYKLGVTPGSLLQVVCSNK